MIKKKIKEGCVSWGIIGVGDVCEVKSAPAMNLISNSRIEAVMRRDAQKAKHYAKRHGIEKWYSDAEALINDPAINAIYVATPPAAHMEYTVKAAQAGKAVYVEKPMARSYKECQAMIDACTATGSPLYTAYYRRALPNFLHIKQLLDDGAIGDVRQVNVRLTKPIAYELLAKTVAQTEINWRVDPQIAGGGYFYDLASHQLDLLDFLLGPISDAQGFAANQAGNYEAEDIVSGSFRFASGVQGIGAWCFSASAHSECDTTTIIGSEGEIRFASFADSQVHLLNHRDGETCFEFQMPKHVQQPLITQVVDDLLGRGECASSGTSGARTNQVMEWMTSLRR